MKGKTVAIVGASADRGKFSNKALRAYVKQGWEVYPVNPKGGTIEGLKVYGSVSEIPVKINRVSLYLPPGIGLGAVHQIATAQPDEFFVNPGAESDQLLSDARDLGLDPIVACSIVDIGASPAEFP